MMRRGVVLAAAMITALLFQYVSRLDHLVGATKPSYEAGFSLTSLIRLAPDPPSRWKVAFDLWHEAEENGCPDEIAGQLCVQSGLQPAHELGAAALAWDVGLAMSYVALLLLLWLWARRVTSTRPPARLIAGPWFVAAVILAGLADIAENVAGRRILAGAAALRPPSSLLAGFVDSATWLKSAALAVIGLAVIVVLARVIRFYVSWGALRGGLLSLLGVIVLGRALVADQSLDTVRRMGHWQVLATAFSLLCFVIVAIGATCRALGARESPTVSDSTARFENFWWLVPSALVAGLAWLTDAPGLYALAAVLAAIAVLSAVVTPPTNTLPATSSIDGYFVCLTVFVLAAAILPRAGLAALASELYVGVGATPTSGAAAKMIALCAGAVLLAALAPLVTALLVDFAGTVENRTATILAAVVFVTPLVMFLDPDISEDVAIVLGAPTTVVIFVTWVIASSALLRGLGMLLRGPATSVRRRRYPTAFERLGSAQPALGLVVVAWLVVSAAARAPSFHDAAIGDELELEPVPMDQAVADWLDNVEPAAGFERSAVPMVLVASSGGGIRAAYWTAAVLTCAIGTNGEVQPSGEYDPCANPVSVDIARERASRLFLGSGISGGSLGLVAVDAWLDQLGGGATVDPTWYRQRLDGDFLAPTLARWLFGDALNQFVRRSDGIDRARALERSWEREWPADELADGFLASQLDGVGPLLLLNSYSAEDGCRLNVSVLSTSPASGLDGCSAMSTSEHPASDLPLLNSTTDLVSFAPCLGDDSSDATARDLARSTAALLSARFPFVTPAGRLACPDGVTYAVDGGYRESTAASPIVELWPAIAAAAEAASTCVVPTFVQLNNGYLDHSSSYADPELSDWLIPLQGQLRSAGGVGDAAMIAAQRIFAGGPNEKPGPFDPMDRYVQISTYSHRGVQAPLGWVLSPAARDDLERQRKNLANIAAIDQLRGWLDGGTTIVPYGGGSVPVGCDGVPIPGDAQTGPPGGGPPPPDTPPPSVSSGGQQPPG